MNAEALAKMMQYASSGKDAVKGWLGWIDAQLVSTLLSSQTGRLDVHGAIAEVGVHHGKSFILLCMSLRDNEKAYCIDVFSDQHLNKDQSGSGDRTALEANLRKFGIDDSKRIIRQASSLEVKSTEIVDAVGPVRFFSVDGGHWLEIVQNDLTIAEACLGVGGIIALDDFHRPEWPDVSAGYFSWYGTCRRKVSPLAIGFNKLYLCEDAWRERYQAVIAANGALAPFCVKRATFQGVDVPVFSEFQLPEWSFRRGQLAYARIAWPNVYVRLRGLLYNLDRVFAGKRKP